MLKILCLHGSRQTASKFENQLCTLEAALRDIAVLEFIDAPHLLLLNAQEDAVDTRSWCTSTSGDGVAEAVGDYTEGDRVVDEAVSRSHPDVLFGFSQGALMAVRYIMRHALEKDKAKKEALVRGIIVAGSPDPRRVFAGTKLLSDYTQAVTEPDKFLLDLPSLHIVGKRDVIVKSTESTEFAMACGSSAGLLTHEHAHSVPQQQSALATIHAFCEGVASGTTAAQEALEARESELDILTAMFDDCIRNRDRQEGAEVILPLFDVSEEANRLTNSEEVASALRHLMMHFRLPRRYPTVLPEVSVTGGPKWHSVAFEKWRADLVLSTTAHMREEAQLGAVAVIMPTWMSANAYALEHVAELQEALVPPRGPGEETGSGSSDEVVMCGINAMAAEWAAEDEEARVANIAEAEAEAERLLLAVKAGKSTKQQQKKKEVDSRATESQDTPAKQQGGSWTLTIGLIGKPSAGKSTFFNAITDPQSESEAAHVAAFPFTTIDPNIGRGFGPLQCPCSVLLFSASSPGSLHAGFTKCDASYGHVPVLSRGDCGNADGNSCYGAACQYRRHPIVVKDVAGLVQGAYQGKGKGNQFLNDLCDADVLVHVVDGAGATNADGTACPPGQGSTLEDISWVRAEVHNWIYDNLQSKWGSIFRTPLKLRTMFSGYRSTPSFVDSVLQLMGMCNELELKMRLKSWTAKDLHLLVALYTRLRFPMVVALNKADLIAADGPTSATRNIASALAERYPSELFCPMTAQVEWDLLVLRKKGIVRYLSGDNTFEVVARKGEDGASSTEGKLEKEDAQRLRRVQAFFSTFSPSSSSERSPLALSGCTGVQGVVALALAQCAALTVFPVAAFTPAIPSLQHCLVFKCGTTAEQVFWAMTYAKLLDGNFVRFEAVNAWRQQDGVAILKKTDTMPAKSVLVRVLSNKRQMAQ